MKKIIAQVIIWILIAMPVCAQYTVQGKIEFERKSNLHRQLDDMMDDDNRIWLEKFKAQAPKFSSSYFDYYFNQNSSLYKPGRETENPLKGFWGSAPAASNIVYTDFKNQRVNAAKKVFEENFLVQDSIRKLQWKILDEVRIIANYKCRKAVSKICDSVYIVAFYTEDIMVSGGPESFGGLPGMILELAIPRLYTTWIATNVEIVAPKPEEMKAPEKGKKVTQKEMYDNIMASISKWGQWAHRSIWWSVL